MHDSIVPCPVKGRRNGGGGEGIGEDESFG